MGKMVTFLIGLVVGGLAGYVAGVLSAPRPGEETRQDWSDRAIELRERAGEPAGRVRQEIGGARPDQAPSTAETDEGSPA